MTCIRISKIAIEETTNIDHKLLRKGLVKTKFYGDRIEDLLRYINILSYKTLDRVTGHASGKEKTSRTTISRDTA